MTYNQLITELASIAGSHAMIKSYRNARPQEWLLNNTAATFPCMLYWVTQGSFDKGNMTDYSVSIWLLDKSGQEYLYEAEVVSDMVGIGADVIGSMRDERKGYIIDDSVPYDIVSDKFEDYLSGIQMTFNVETYTGFTNCDIPTI